MKPGDLYAQPDRRPTRKVAAGAVGAATATLAVWLVSLTGVEVPAGIEGAIAVLVGAVIAYLTHERWVPAEKLRRKA